MGQVIQLKTLEGTKIWVAIDQITAIEIIPNTMRAEGYTKIYIPGFEIRTNFDHKKLLKMIEPTLTFEPAEEEG